MVCAKRPLIGHCRTYNKLNIRLNDDMSYQADLPCEVSKTVLVFALVKAGLIMNPAFFPQGVLFMLRPIMFDPLIWPPEMTCKVKSWNPFRSFFCRLQCKMATFPQKCTSLSSVIFSLQVLQRVYSFKSSESCITSTRTMSAHFGSSGWC
jgi:hypothetical protein